MKILCLLITLMLPFCLFAKDCKYVNLIESDESPFTTKIPIYSQGELATCYAYTSSQLIDYYQYSHGKDLGLTNALWTAFIHKIKRKRAHWSPDSFNFSLMQWTLDDLSRYGICKNEQVKKSIEKLKHGADLSDDDVMYFFHELWDSYHHLHKGLLQDPEPEEYKLAFEETVNKMPFELRDEFRKLRKPLNRIVRFNSKDARMEFLQEYVFVDCQGDAIYSPQIGKTKSSGRFWAGDKKIAKTIEKSFDQNIPQPLGIGYCSHIYESKYDGEAEYAMDGSSLVPRVLRMARDQKACSPHYSVLAGQRSGKGKRCDYLIRNTYGSGFWTDKYPCLCERTVEGKRELYECQKGQTDVVAKVLACWIPGDDLLPKTFDVNYFKE